MEDIGMKSATLLAITIATFTSIPLLAQQANVGANAQQSSSAGVAGTHLSDSTRAGASATAGSGGVSADGSAHTNGAVAASRFGDQAASHASQMSSVSGELQGKLDSKTAKAGDRVVLKTTEKVRTDDGTVIPKGTRLVGQITKVQAYDKAHGDAQLGIAFDHAELKNGEDIAIHSLIRGVSPSATAASLTSGDDEMGASIGGGGRMGGGHAGGGLLSGAGGAASGAGNLAGGTVARTSDTMGALGGQTTAAVDSTGGVAAQTAGHGGLDLNGGVNAAAAGALTAPRLTGIPGVMLAGNSSASGILSASKKNIHFESGTQMQLGLVVDR
jgi:hypothetical protein